MNVHLDAMEHDDTIAAFMYSIQEGATSKSYGLEEATLSGIQRHLIQRTQQKLKELESVAHHTPESNDGNPPYNSAPFKKY